MISSYQQQHADRAEAEADETYHRLTDELKADVNWQRCTARQIHFEVKRMMDKMKDSDE